MDNALKISMLDKMIEIRLFEEKLSELRYKGDVMGAVHCCIGQEAVSVGTCYALNKRDYIMGTHRSHGYMLAKGAGMNGLMAEIMGKATGTNGGRGGSLHVCDTSVGAIGATGIVGSGLPVACGTAFASKYNKDNKVTLVFFGDGASNEGTFHECMNLAAIWKLPIIFMLENNGVAVTTLNKNTTNVTELYKRAMAYGVPGYRVDGQDPEKVYSEVRKAVEHARNGKGPTLIEAVTYRFQEHAEGKGYLRMQGTGYRSEEDVAMWKREKDPVVLYSKRLISDKIITVDDIDGIYKDVKKRVSQAVEYGLSSPFPDVTTVRDNVYI